MVVEYQYTTEPQHNHNHHGTQELRHGMGRRLADVYTHDVVAIGRVDGVETLVHLIFGAEGLDDAQTT